MPRDNEKISVYIDVISQAEKRFKDIEKSFSDMTKQLSAGVQQINRNFAGIHHSLNNLHSAFSDLSKTNEKLVSSLSKTASTNKNVKESVSGVTSTVKGQHFAWRGLVWTIVRAEIVYRGIMRILRATKDAFVALTENIDQYRNSMIRIAALQTTAFQPFVRNANELKEVFNALYESSQKTYQSIETLSIRTPLTAQQLMRVYQAFLAYGQNVDLTNRKVREGLLGMANAIYLLTGGLNLSRQLFQEVRSLVTGRRIGGDVYNFLISQNEQLKESIKLWVRQGTLVEHLSDILGSFVIAGNKSLDTIKGLSTTLRTMFAREARQAFSDAYYYILNFLKVLVKSPAVMEQFRNSVTLLGQSLIVFGEIIGKVTKFLYFLGYSTRIGIDTIMAKWDKFVGKLFHWKTVLEHSKFWEARKQQALKEVYDLEQLFNQLDALQKKIFNASSQGSLFKFAPELTKSIQPVQTALRSFQEEYQKLADKSRSATLKTLQNFSELKTSLDILTHSFFNMKKHFAEMILQLDKFASSPKARNAIKETVNALKTGDTNRILASLYYLRDAFKELGRNDLVKQLNLMIKTFGLLSFRVTNARQNFEEFAHSLSSKINNELAPVFDRWQRQLYNISKGLHFSFGEDEVSRQLDSITNRFQNAKLQLTQLLTAEQQKAMALRNYLKQDDLPDQVRTTIQKNLSLVNGFIMRTIYKLNNLKQAEEQVKQAYLDWYFTTQEKKIKLDIIGLQEGSIAQQLANLRQNYEQQKQLFEKYHKDTTDLTLRYKLQQKQIVDSVEEQITDKVATEEERRILEARKWRDAEIQNLRVLRQQGLITAQEYNQYLHQIEKGYTNLLSKQNKTLQIMRQAGHQVARAMQQTFSDFFFDAFTNKLKSLGDYFRTFGNSLLRIWADVLSQMMTQAILASSFIKSITSWIMGTASPAPSPQVVTAANGGILQGEFLPIRKFAYGGIVDRPTLGLVGEGKYKEAVVPLPDGKSIPAVVKDNSKPEVVINIENKGEPVDFKQKGMHFDGKKWVINCVMEAYVSDPTFRNMFHGGA